MHIEMKTRRLCFGLIGVGGVFAVSACQTSAPVYIAQPAAELVAPAVSPQIIVERHEDGVRVNSLGGEIPSAQPAMPVGNEGMDEVR